MLVWGTVAAVLWGAAGTVAGAAESCEDYGGLWGDASGCTWCLSVAGTDSPSAELRHCSLVTSSTGNSN